MVEDSIDLVEIWEKLFKASGFTVSACHDGQSALRLIRHQPSPFDVVLSDYYLPDINGLVLFDHVREWHPKLPFLLVTGTREAFIAEHIQKGGFAALVGKPVLFKTLIGKINEFCAG